MLKNKTKIKIKKNGAGSIMLVIVISMLIPLLLFGLVDVPYYMQYHKKMKSIVNTVASSSITRINEDELATGLLVLDYNQTRTTLFQLLEKWYGLEPYTYQIAGHPEYVMGMKRIVKTSYNGATKYDSMLDKDPLVIELKKGTPPITSSQILDSTRIEFFIHTGMDQYTYIFSDGNSITVDTPTVGVYVRSVSPGVIFKQPMVVQKLGISEVILDPTIDY